MKSFNLVEERYPNRRFWAFKHKPGESDEKVCMEFVRRACSQNVCMMQYEYGHQDAKMVTMSWRAVLQIKTGDVVFLRGDSRAYAVGVVVPHGIEDGVNIKHRCAAEIVSANSHGGCESSIDRGCVVFADSEVFYEDFCDGEDGWGQRVRVDQWRFFSDDGVWCRDNDHYVDQSQVYTPVRELKPEAAGELLEGLKTQYLKKKGIPMGVMELLLANKNVILTGAPGTGKTYTALAIAKELTGGDQNRIRLVQFHPGYDYSDFVMGLKPVLLDENGNEVPDGESKSKVTVSYRWKPGVFKMFADAATADAATADAATAVAKSGDTKTADTTKNYVLVIDEINRADLSRVFGELFSLIEMDYRGEAKVTLPNGEEFSVPKNLYIIGTMNDIDRSVDSMDFALRRRFAWYEVTAESSERIIDAKLTQHSEAAGRLKDAMKTLNDYIGGKPKLKVGEREISLGLGTEYQLGGAIFANAEKYEGTGWETKLWENHIKVILSEYLRGNRDKMAILEALEAEYKDKIGLQA